MEHHGEQSLNRVAFSATVHCLTGCAIGEVLGMIIGTALDWGNRETIVLVHRPRVPVRLLPDDVASAARGHDARGCDPRRAGG